MAEDDDKPGSGADDVGRGRSASTPTPTPTPTRREALTYLNAGAVGLITVCVGVPAVAYVIDPGTRETVTGATGPVPVADAAQVLPSAPLRVQVRTDQQLDAWTKHANVALGAAWLVNAGGNIHALSTTCPHLGCSVGYDAGAKVFRCPCHTSAFGMDGERISGPAKRGMDPLPVKIENGKVWLEYQRFALDVADRRKV